MRGGADPSMGTLPACRRVPRRQSSHSEKSEGPQRTNATLQDGGGGMTEGGNTRRVNVPSLYGKARPPSRRKDDGRNFTKNGDGANPINSELRGYGVRETPQRYVMHLRVIAHLSALFAIVKHVMDRVSVSKNKSMGRNSGPCHMKPDH